MELSQIDIEFIIAIMSGVILGLAILTTGYAIVCITSAIYKYIKKRYK